LCNLFTRFTFLGLYRMDYADLGIIRCSSLLKLLKLHGELLAYRLNGDAQWAHLRPQRRVSPTGVIHPEGKVR